MEAKTVDPITTAAQERFFQALDMLIDQKRVTGLQTFCNKYGLHRAKYSNLRTFARNPNRTSRYKLIDLEAVIYIVRDYGVSADWILLGLGGMFK